MTVLSLRLAVIAGIVKFAARSHRGTTLPGRLCRSPDRDPSEKLWACVERAVAARCADTAFQGREAAVRTARTKLGESERLLETVAHSMPRGWAVVVEAKGLHTSY